MLQNFQGRKCPSSVFILQIRPTFLPFNRLSFLFYEFTCILLSHFKLQLTALMPQKNDHDKAFWHVLFAGENLKRGPLASPSVWAATAALSGWVWLISKRMVFIHGRAISNLSSWVAQQGETTGIVSDHISLAMSYSALKQSLPFRRP